MLSSVTTPRTITDYVLAALAASVLLGLIGIGVDGTFTGFLQSRSYLDANEWVALICGFIGAGCAFYLLLEFTDLMGGQAKFAICLVCGMFSVFAVSKDCRRPQPRSTAGRRWCVSRSPASTGAAGAVREM